MKMIYYYCSCDGCLYELVHRPLYPHSTQSSNYWYVSGESIYYELASKPLWEWRSFISLQLLRMIQSSYRYGDEHYKKLAKSREVPKRFEDYSSVCSCTVRSITWKVSSDPREPCSQLLLQDYSMSLRTVWVIGVTMILFLLLRRSSELHLIYCCTSSKYADLNWTRCEKSIFVWIKLFVVLHVAVLELSLNVSTNADHICLLFWVVSWDTSCAVLQNVDGHIFDLFFIPEYPQSR